MLPFFQQRFAYIHQLNLLWMHHLIALDVEFPIEIQQIISEIVNYRHIAVCELNERDADSELSDFIPEKHWIAFERDNAQQWTNCFFDLFEETEADLVDVPPILFQVLHQNSLYLGQLEVLVKQQGLPLVDSKLIPVS